MLEQLAGGRAGIRHGRIHGRMVLGVLTVNYCGIQPRLRYESVANIS